ncbi:hypothetical protein TELCIR_10944 [Teladorsagia circumcincta]|uniref:Uncharacterized protein n=1 Tax=Teladorsagia circumcincta TaxID=45464 RepID=A0A2G9UAP4_TELCI|nr:hypothetical protein TELCIR_10944 [Teladorsagia circumcincta]
MGQLRLGAGEDPGSRATSLFYHFPPLVEKGSPFCWQCVASMDTKKGRECWYKVIHYVIHNMKKGFLAGRIFLPKASQEEDLGRNTRKLREAKRKLSRQTRLHHRAVLRRCDFCWSSTDFAPDFA